MANDESEFARASAAFDAWRAAEPAEVGENGRSLLLDHGRRTPRVVLLLHGLTAAPRQFLAFGALLHRAGDTVVIPRLPFHGHGDRMTETLAQLRTTHLRAFAMGAAALAAGFGDEVIVVGFSVGGLLATWIAQHVAVDRVIAVAPFFGFAVLPRPLATPIARVARRLPNAFIYWHPFERERHGPNHGYPRYSTHAVAEAYALGRELLAEAKLRGPLARQVMFVRNGSETTVRNRTVRMLAARLRRSAPGRIHEYRIDGFPPSHDVIEPLGSPRLAGRVYPLLFAFVHA